MDGGSVRPTWTSKCGTVQLYLGDCLDVLPTLAPGSVDVVVTDPPYGETSLAWDRWQQGWIDLIHPSSMWVCGSLRMFLQHAAEFANWKLSQDVIWKKHNGSNFHADRFRRVHEHALHFYRGTWESVYKSVQVTMDATKRTVRRKERPTHTGAIENSTFVAQDGGPRLMTSIIEARSCHGHAVHPTQKPVAFLAPLIEYACPPAGTVLDPFMGSGTTGVAAVRLGRRFIGIEIDPDYFEKAKRRIQDELRRVEFLEPKRAAERQASLFGDGER
jgi:site-specific DNA-methyltransferase (adenine-specific)